MVCACVRATVHGVRTWRDVCDVRGVWRTDDNDAPWRAHSTRRARTHAHKPHTQTHTHTCTHTHIDIDTHHTRIHTHTQRHAHTVPPRPSTPARQAARH